MSRDALSNRRTGELEVGLTDVLARHPTVHLAADHTVPVPSWLLSFEASRPQLLRCMIAEAMGTFSYVYCGVSATVTFTLTSAAKETGFGSLLQIAFGFAFGIAFALIVGATTSGGHFNPVMSLVFATMQGFSWKKVPFYIFAQCFGAFIACLVIYAQWHDSIKAYEAELTALGLPLISATGPAGMFVAIPLATQSKKAIFANEFFADSFIGMIIWAAVDTNNLFMSPSSAPFVIGLAYFCMIGGFGANTLSTNTARDFGARCMAAIFYGRGVFTVKPGYAAIAILTNIPATFLGVFVYQAVCGDSRKLMNRGAALPAEVHQELQRERAVSGGGQHGPLETYLRKHPTAREEQYTNGAGNGIEKSSEV